MQETLNSNPSYLDHAERMPKTPIYSRENYEVSLQVEDYHPLLHLDIHKWAPSTYKAIKLDLDNIKLLLRSFGMPHIFGVAPFNNEKLYKLYDKLGIKYLTDYEQGKIFVMETKDGDS